MNALIKPSTLSGNVVVPSSKSIAHRAILASFLSGGQSKIKNISFCDDIKATLNAIRDLGADYELLENKTVSIKKAKSIDGQVSVDCNESGSTIRFLIPILAALGINGNLYGRGRLFNRPYDPYFLPLKSNGARLSVNRYKQSAQISGNLKSGEFILDGNVSSQFVSGLLFALPLLDGVSKIKLLTPLESKPYVDLTISVLNYFGVDIIITHDGYEVPGNQKYNNTDYYIEGDWSQAAFFQVMGIKNDLNIKGLEITSSQGDKKMYDLIRSIGGNISFVDGTIRSCKSEVEGFEFDISHTPDLAPAVAVLASIAKGKSKIIGGSRLKLKESDRIKSITSFLNGLGGKIKIYNDNLLIDGIGSFVGGRINSFNDHRIVMAATLASVFSKGEIIIEGSECVNKSYPNFFDDFINIGGVVTLF